MPLQINYVFSRHVNGKYRDSTSSSKSDLGMVSAVFALLLKPPLYHHALKTCSSVLDCLRGLEFSEQLKIAAAMLLESIALHMPMHRNPFKARNEGSPVAVTTHSILICMALLDFQLAWFKLKETAEGNTCESSVIPQLVKKFPSADLVPRLFDLLITVLRLPLETSAQHLAVATAAKAAKLILHLHQGNNGLVGSFQKLVLPVLTEFPRRLLSTLRDRGQPTVGCRLLTLFVNPGSESGCSLASRWTALVSVPLRPVTASDGCLMRMLALLAVGLRVAPAIVATACADLHNACLMLRGGAYQYSCVHVLENVYSAQRVTECKQTHTRQ